MFAFIIIAAMLLFMFSYDGEKVRGLYDGQGVACFVGGHRYEVSISRTNINLNAYFCLSKKDQ